MLKEPNWREKFNKEFDYDAGIPIKQDMAVLIFIETLIEQIIDDIPENKVYGHQSEAISEIKQQLKSKYLC